MALPGDIDTGPALDALEADDHSPLAVTRRRFLQAVAVTGAAAAVPSWLAEAAGAAEPVGPNQGILVVVLLAGGNDGLNTVVPLELPQYRDQRKALAIPPERTLPIGGGFGLHANLPTVKSMWDQGKVAIVHGVGYSDPNLSHFDSMAIWMSGLAGANRIAPHGWLGRYLDGLAAGNPTVDPLLAVSIGSRLPPHLRGRNAMATALPTNLSGAFGADRRNAWELGLFDAVKAFAAGPQLGPYGTLAAKVGADTIDLGPRLTPSYESLPRGKAVTDLALCARLINANLGIRVLGISFGDFDTHASQPNRHDELMKALDDALAAFFTTLAPQWRSRVTVMTFSEFGRRPELNGSNGTDHGTASNLFVIGENVRGGFFGQHQSLTDLDRARNFKHTVDFKAVYASVLDGWLGADSQEILGGRFEHLGLFAAAPGAATPSQGGSGVPIFGGRNPGPGGYWLCTVNGEVTAFGANAHFGNAPAGSKVVAMASTPTGNGYWLVTEDGAVFAFGRAPYKGGMNGKPLAAPIVDVCSTPSGDGYWLLGRDGGVFSFGDARFFGSTGAIRLNRPVVGMAACPSGNGYWFVAEDGGVFAYGPDAGFHGSTGSMKLNQPVVGMAPSPSGRGYWLCAKDGGIFAFGDAPFHGSTGSMKLNQPIVGMTASKTGRGYWFVAADGGVFAFGDAPFHGSLGGRPGVVVTSMGG